MSTDRVTWGSKIGFILAGAGSAIGLGNIWRFPQLAEKYDGGTFLIVYLLIIFTIGISVLIAELAIGRAAQRNPVGAYAKLKGGLWPLAGYFGVATAFIIISFYGVIGGWAIAYLIRALDGSLIGADAESVFGNFVSDTYEPLFYQAAFMALTIALVYRGIRSGIERGCELLLPILFVLLIVLVVFTLGLEGADKGVAFFLTPDFSKLSFDLFNAALGQVFFSVGVGLGIMITYGSYMSRQVRLSGSATWIVFLDLVVSVLAGLLVLSAVFAFGKEVGGGGPGLTFITLPLIFTEMVGGQYIAIAFFFLLIIAALTSAISIMEVVVSYVIDEWHLDRKDAALMVGIMILLFGIPSSLSTGSSAALTNLYGTGAGFLDWMDYLTGTYALPIGGLLVIVFATWMIPNQITEEVTASGSHGFVLQKVWMIICKFIAPIAIAWILLGKWILLLGDYLFGAT